MKDLDEAYDILGINIHRDRSKKILGLSQSRYIDLMLKRFNMEVSKRGYLPVGYDIHFSKKMYPKTHEERKRMSEIPYVSGVRSFMYVMLHTTPDVACTFGIASRFQTDPGEDH